MKKRELMEWNRLLQIKMFNLYEMPENWGPRQKAEEQGYRYLRITITDVKTGKKTNLELSDIKFEGEPPATSLYTFRKDEDLNKLINDLLSIAEWPKELLEDMNPAIYADGEVWLDGTKTARQIVDRQLLGGRPKQEGVSDKTAKKYRNWARRYHRSNLTQKEFCNEVGVSRSTLYRALKFVSENGP